MGLTTQQASVLANATSKVCASTDGQQVFAITNLDTAKTEKGIEVTGSCQVTDGYEAVGENKFLIIIATRGWLYQGVALRSPSEVAYSKTIDPKTIMEKIPMNIGMGLFK